MALTADSGGFQRQVEFQHGWNELHDKSPGSMGQHGMEIVFALVGDRGAVQIALNTGWTPLGPVDEPLKEERGSYPDKTLAHPKEPSISHLYPGPRSIAYHWAHPFREDMNPTECELMLNGECYADVSFRGASEILRDFISNGEAFLWKALEKEYWGQCINEDQYRGVSEV